MHFTTFIICLILCVVSTEGGELYLGCYKEDATDRGDAQWSSSKVGSPSLCAEWCTGVAPGAPFLHFSLKKGKVCTCRTTYGALGKGAAHHCNVYECAAQPSLLCGGTSYAKVFEVSDAKPTASPPTPAPETPSPPTAIPTVTPTSIPDTLAPSSEIPISTVDSTPTETNAPIKSAPKAGLSSSPSEAPQREPIVEMVWGAGDERTHAAVVLVSLFSGGFAPLTASRLSLVASGCARGTFAMQPSGVAVAGSAALGAVLVNTGGVLVFVVLLWCIAYIGSKKLAAHHPHMVFICDSLGLRRVRPLFTFACIVLYQSYTLNGLVLVNDAGSIGLFVVGFGVVVLCIAVPYALCVHVIRRVPVFAVHAVVGSRKRASGWQSVVVFFVGRGEWVNIDSTKHVVERNVHLLRDYRAGCEWYGAVEFGTALSIAAIQCIVAKSEVQCAHIHMAMGGVFLVHLLALCAVRPYSRARDTFTFGILSVLQMIAMVLSAVSHHNTTKSATPETILLICGAILIAKAFCDICVGIYLAVSYRRGYLQQNIYKSLDPLVVNAVSEKGHIDHPTVLVSMEDSDHEQNETWRSLISVISDDSPCVSPRSEDLRCKTYSGCPIQNSRSPAEAIRLAPISSASNSPPTPGRDSTSRPRRRSSVVVAGEGGLPTPQAKVLMKKRLLDSVGSSVGVGGQKLNRTSTMPNMSRLPGIPPRPQRRGSIAEGIGRHGSVKSMSSVQSSHSTAPLSAKCDAAMREGAKKENLALLSMY